MSIKEDSDEHRINLLRAAVADFAVTWSIVRHVLSDAGSTDATTISTVGGYSEALWSAVGRNVILSSFNLADRLVASFARDEAVDLLALFSESEHPRATPLLGKEFTEGLAPGERYDEWSDRFAQAMKDAGLEVVDSLPSRLVALKVLRNECLHVKPTSRAKAAFLEASGLGVDVTRLTLSDTLATLHTLGELISSLAGGWEPDGWSAVRTDIVSDLQVMLRELAELLQRDDVAAKEKAWRL